MDKKELIEDFLDNRTFQIKVEQLDVARNELGLLINSIIQQAKEAEREKQKEWHLKNYQEMIDLCNKALEVTNE